MLLKRLFASAAGLALLAACASPEPVPVKPVLTPAAAITQADQAFAAGKFEQAIGLLQSATVTHPSEKAPWLKLAQFSLETRQYDHAMAAALEVLERDAADGQAQGIVALAGLRLSLKALTELSGGHKLPAGLRSDAQELARQLRTRLADEPAAAPRKKSETAIARGSPLRPAPAPAAAPKDEGDPFATLKN